MNSLPSTTHLTKTEDECRVQRGWRQGFLFMRQVRKLPRDTGETGWNAILGPAPAYPEAEGEITADWLVIGGGFAGLSAAKRLTELRGGDRILLIEAGRIGAGPAGRNSGFMIDLPHELSGDGYAGSAEGDRLQITLNRHAQNFARATAIEYEMPDEAVNPIGRVNGAVNASGASHNAAYARQLDHLGEAYKALDAAEMKELTGSDFYRSGLFLPGAVMLQPALYVREMAAGLTGKEQSPVDIFEASPATGYERQGDSWLVTTPKSRIAAKRVIMAVNGHAESFGFFRQRLMHVFTYASMTVALNPSQMRALGGMPAWGITPADPMGSTIRRHHGIGGNRLIIRNRWTYEPSMEVTEARVAAFRRDHERAFRRRFPMLEDVGMTHSWGGRLCLSRNAVPAFGEVETGFFSACCQNGLGTAKGTLSGIGAVELATRSNSPIVRDLQSYDAPQKLPPPPIARLGATLLLRWREWKAGAEI
jgi:glycine/D-amino acid oxidase-like deaminating enzyme